MSECQGDLAQCPGHWVDMDDVRQGSRESATVFATGFKEILESPSVQSGWLHPMALAVRVTAAVRATGFR